MSNLDQLFYWRGIEASYNNYRGEHTEVPVENRLILLKAMGVNIGNEEAISKAAFELDVSPWMHLFPKLQTTTLTPDGSSFYINFSPSQLTQKLDWSLRDSHIHII